jgi:long-chain acyl-CoA synthetase
MRWQSLDDAAKQGMGVACVAAAHPDRPALLSETGSRSFAELNARANQAARALRRAGLGRGDGVALVCRNRTEFAEVFFATQRAGLRLTPVNWHLTPEEIAYVVADSGAKALIFDAAFADAAPQGGRLEESADAQRAAGERSLGSPTLRLRLSVGGALPGFADFDAALAAEADSDIEDASLGDTMLYTSGTTGKPKGVRRPPPDPERAVLGWKLLVSVFDFRPDAGDVALATGPLYHSGPINLCLAIPLGNGIPTVLMEKWDAEAMLRAIAAHRITHTFCVPTMFRRLLALPEAVRRRYDVSSLRFVIHGAAPCPVEDKRAIIEWFGPIVTELYAATEGMGTLVSSQEWLKRPGTVGRPAPDNVRILDEAGSPLPAGEIGTVWLRPVGGADFEYHGDADKKRGAHRDGFFTVGDVGRLDADGYLFLTGRTAEVVITGGTNVYPAEIDDVVLAHPDVEDAAVVGVPDPEWGEVLRAVVVPAQRAAADAALSRSILDHCEAKLPTFKRPRSVEFVDEIPRSAAGKILRRQLRDRHPG